LRHRCGRARSGGPPADTPDAPDAPDAWVGAGGCERADRRDARLHRLTGRRRGLTITQGPVELAGSKLITDETDALAVAERLS
jgi:hypothetical protein